MNRFCRIFVRLGEHGASEYGPQDYYIERVTVHERFVKSGRGPSYDIAIIRLSDFIPFSSMITYYPAFPRKIVLQYYRTACEFLGDIQPICLPIDRRWRSLDISDIFPYVAGWGSPSYCSIFLFSFRCITVCFIKLEMSQMNGHPTY